MYILKILLHEICVLNYLVTSYLAKVVPISVPLFMHSEVKRIMKSQSNFYYVLAYMASSGGLWEGTGAIQDDKYLKW